MSELILMRHGQASFLSGDYDRLSELGWDQARRLGIYMASQEHTPTTLVVGPRRRQRESAEAVRSALLDAGMPCPEPVFDDRLDEFDWDGIFRYANTTLSAADAEVNRLKQAFDDAVEIADKRRHIQHYMEAVTKAWAREAFYEEGIETWAEFRGRVQASIHAHTSNALGGSRILIVTSGGVAAAAVGGVLGLVPEKTLGLIWTLRNAALVEFLFSGTRMSLSAFNSAPHLPNKALWTYR